MSPPLFFFPKGIFFANNFGKNGDTSSTNAGARLDVEKEINEVNVRVIGTDRSARDYENAPFFKDAVVTASKRINSNLAAQVGYDFGAKAAIASATADTNVADTDVQVRATWHQAGNAVKAEGSAKLEKGHSLYGLYVHNGGAAANNFYFLEKNDYTPDPFNLHKSQALVKYTYEHDDWSVEPWYDFNKKAPYLGVAKRQGRNTLRGAYAFQEETALFELTHTPIRDDVPNVRVFVKSPAGRNGVGPLSVGLTLDKSVQL